MNFYARIVDGVVAEVVELPAGYAPSACFPESVASQFVSCTSSTMQGMTYSNGAFTVPAVVAPTKNQLTSHANIKASAIEAGGITVDIGTAASPQKVECATDNATYLRLMAANSVAIANPNQTQPYPFASGVVTLTAAQIETIFNSITALYATVTTQLATIINAITAGTITTYEEIDTPPSSIPAWPVNN